MSALDEPPVGGHKRQIVDERRGHEETISGIVVPERDGFAPQRDLVIEVRFPEGQFP